MSATRYIQTMATGGELREFFHLLFLRHFGERIRDRKWAVKGGICLRFFHRSPRFSEDMDLDTEPGIRLDTLQKSVDHILESRSFRSSLASRGAVDLDFKRPKQTTTTQRWKITLKTGGGQPVYTKLEFSKRSRAIAFTSGLPSPAVLERHIFPPFTARHYAAGPMAAQKASALASPQRNAARDLFDLDHLLTTLSTGPDQYAELLEPSVLKEAASRAGAFTWRSFKEEVLPFLDPSVMEMFSLPGGFEALKQRVIAALTMAMDRR